MMLSTALTLALLGLGLAQIPPKRSLDPVILTGVQVPEMMGESPDRIVGFRFEGNQWEQVPIQIDERHMQDWLEIKQGDCRLIGRHLFGHVWADSNTYSGADQDASFDVDDELVFMARHLGQQKPPGFYNPPDTLLEKEAELEIQDPVLNHQTVGFLYLYLSDTLSPGAGVQLVDYNFNLIKTDENGSNAYKDAYQFNCTDGTNDYTCHDDIFVNPEDTWVTTPFYERHYAENWYSDELKIKAGGANGIDILNTQDFQFLLRNCGRSQASFVRGRTAFIINKAGPVRALRSWVGANSGTITQRETHMYEQREDQVTYLRVHTIPGVFDYINYEAGVPLQFYNCHNMLGLAIDGVDEGPEAFNKTLCLWDMVTGNSGSVVRGIDINHNFGDWAHYPNFDPSIFIEDWFYDNEVANCSDCGDHHSAVHPNDWHMCSSMMNGKTEAWGTHGIKSKPPYLVTFNTDPARHILYDSLPEDACDVEVIEPWLFHLNITYHNYFLPPFVNPIEAEEYQINGARPLVRHLN